jgi:hypothetical protein
MGRPLTGICRSVKARVKWPIFGLSPMRRVIVSFGGSAGEVHHVEADLINAVGQAGGVERAERAVGHGAGAFGEGLPGRGGAAATAGLELPEVEEFMTGRAGDGDGFDVVRVHQDRFGLKADAAGGPDVLFIPKVSMSSAAQDRFHLDSDVLDAAHDRIGPKTSVASARNDRLHSETDVAVGRNGRIGPKRMFSVPPTS